MNKVILAGRLTADPDVNYSNKDGEQLCIAAYTLAIDRKGKKNEADFVRCKAFGKAGEFAEKYLHKGIKMMITGRIQTGSYENKEGKKVYTTDVIVEEHEFCESKKNDDRTGNSGETAPEEGFMDIPKDVENIFKRR